jgi:hypothetical protein
LTNCLTLGQAFKFYDFQKESIRFAVARTFMRLYKDSYKYQRRITHRHLHIAYDRIKDIRNICAHDERLYSARLSPSGKVTLADCISEMSLTLTESQYAQLLQDIVDEVIECTQSIKTVSAKRLLNDMGYSSLDDLAYACG